jgi:hypothetical protein
MKNQPDKKALHDAYPVSGFRPRARVEGYEHTPPAFVLTLKFRDEPLFSLWFVLKRRATFARLILMLRRWRMGTRNERLLLVKTLLIVVLLFLNACSAQKPVDDDFLVDGKDPFDDAFFADSPQGDSSVLQQSEFSSTEPMKESDEPKSFKDKAEEALFSSVLIGGMVAKMFFLPFLGL